MRRQPVITGLGIVSPIGIGVDNFWRAALAGRSGIGTATLFDPSKLPPECRIVGEVKDFNPLDWMPARVARVAGRFSQFAVAAAKMALEDSGLDTTALPEGALKVAIGSSMNGLTDIHQPSFQSFLAGEGIKPYAAPEFPAHAATAHVAELIGSSSQLVTLGTACVAGLDSIAWAADQIEQGEAAVVVAGATETPLSPCTVTACHSSGVLSSWPGPPEEASRPFDRLRSGLVIAEGAAIVVVEALDCAEARGALPYARILGSSSLSGGRGRFSLKTAPHSIAAGIETALHDANLSPVDVDYVCAHGNSMPEYDEAETLGIKKAFGRQAWNIPISSLKSMCGQALAASSAMQVVATSLAIRDGFVPPTINYTMPDPTCDLDYVPNLARPARVRSALVHAQSIGGCHTIVILGGS